MKLNFTFYCLIALLMFAACSDDDEDSNPNTISAKIDGENWESKDIIPIELNDVFSISGEGPNESSIGITFNGPIEEKAYDLVDLEVVVT